MLPTYVFFKLMGLFFVQHRSVNIYPSYYYTLYSGPFAEPESKQQRSGLG